MTIYTKLLHPPNAWQDDEIGETITMVADEISKIDERMSSSSRLNPGSAAVQVFPSRFSPGCGWILDNTREILDKSKVVQDSSSPV